MRSHIKSLNLSLYILLSTYIVLIRAQKIVGTWNGLLNGTTLKTRNGRTIDAFLGIPYGKSPIGPLRFKNPVEADYWDNSVRDATTDGNQCPQFSDDGLIVGDEDCLYLNVYTPRILLDINQILFPTMVYIHGGDFVKGNGSSTMFGPEYLLDKDIVLVTINYRLGVLGFLSSGDDQAPGNFGLKDQVLALQWVIKNIPFFGGDKDQVTLFGQGAGSVSAQLHTASPLSDGLFKRIILQSGTASCFWAYRQNAGYKEYATKLGEYLKCPTANSRDLIDCLRKVDIHRLVDSNEIFDSVFHPFEMWGPTNEPRLYGAFLTDPYLYKVLKNELKDYPSMIGHVADEGLIFTAPYYTNEDMYERIVNNLDAFILNLTKVAFDKLRPKKYAARIKDFYFNGMESSQKEIFLKNMTNLMSDTAFLFSGAYIEEEILNFLNYSAYLYSFNYRGTFSKTSRVIGSNDNIGVTHGDELTYIFPASPKQFGEQQLELSVSDEQIINVMVDLWTSFASTGVPSTKRFSDPNYWQPYKNDNGEYLIIGNNSDPSLSRQSHYREKRKTFWLEQAADRLYGSYFWAVAE